MATTTFDLKRPDLFPEATSVGAYPASSFSTADLPPTGAPRPSAVATATVTSGVAAFTGLTASTTYFFAASVSGTWRYVRGRTDAVDSSQSGGASSGEGAPLTLGAGLTYFEMTSGVVTAEWVGTTGSVPVKVADLTGTPSSAYTAARQTANDAIYARNAPNVVLPILAGGNPTPTTPVTYSGVNVYRLSRCIIPKTGKLRDVTVFVAATAGNIKGLVYDTGATRTKLYEGSSVAAGTANSWQILCDPNIDVVAGQQIDLGCIIDNASITLGRTAAAATATNGVQLPSAFDLGVAALPKLTCVSSALGSFAGPATIAEGSMAITANPLLAIARIS